MSGAFSVILLINLDNCVTTHRKMKKILALFVLTISMLGAKNACAQNRTMFEYPIAPDTCTTLESRCNYSTAHFWDNFEFHKPLTAESDSILMSTFIDFFQIMSSANRNVGQSAVRLLMNKAQVNHPNFLRLMGAAEYLLYYTPQPLIDDVYLAFAQSAVEASWVEKKVKSHYAEQIRTINNTKLGSDIYNFSVTDANGEKKKIHDLPLDSAEIVLLFFTNDEIESCSHPHRNRPRHQRAGESGLHQIDECVCGQRAQVVFGRGFEISQLDTLSHHRAKELGREGVAIVCGAG